MSVTSELLPEPETPVTAINVPSGKSTVRFCRLFSRAPIRCKCLPLPARLRSGTIIWRSPVRNLPGDRLRGAAYVRNETLGDDSPTVHASARTDIDDPVGGPHHFFVVLDDDQGVAEIAELEQGADQAGVVPLMQADARFVEDVEHAHQAGTDLGRQSNALRFAA